MGKQDVSVDSAVRLIEFLIRRLGRLDRKEGEGDEDALISFPTKGEGGSDLSSEEVELYDQCVDRIVEAYDTTHAGRNGAGLISPKSAVSILRDAAAEVLDAGKSARVGPGNPVFEQTLATECNKVRARLVSTSEWVIISPVRGIDKASRSFTVGRVDFAAATQKGAEALASRIGDYEPPAGEDEEKVKGQIFLRKDAQARVVKDFSEDWTATLKVSAFDQQSAASLGLAEIRRSVEVINFFLPFLNLPLHGRVIMPPETARATVLSVAYPSRGDGLHIHRDFSHHFPPVRIPGVRSGRAKTVGLTRASDLLAKPIRNSLEERLLKAIRWAGRANVELNAEARFLFYAIALEALLTKERSQGGVTDRTKLRVAHLIGLSAEARRKVYQEMNELYKIRSTIVHEGSAAGLTKHKINMIRALAGRAITAVLNHRYYRDMTSAKELEDRLDDMVVSATVPKIPR